MSSDSLMNLAGCFRVLAPPGAALSSVMSKELDALRAERGARHRIHRGVLRRAHSHLAMSYRVDADALIEFVRRQVVVVESSPTSESFASVAGPAGAGITPSELRAIWLAAGVATFIGQAITDDPERFVVEIPTDK